MRIRNFFTIFTVISLTTICLYYISFSFYISNLEKKAYVYSNGNLEKTKKYLESKKRIGFLKYNHFFDKNKSINLGLDLKGGISMILEISEKDLLKKFSDNSKNPIFLKSLENADKKKEKNPNTNYISSFLNSFYQEKKKQNIDFSISDLFGVRSHIDEINYSSSNKEIEKILRKKIEKSISSTYNILRSRIDKFGVIQPNIQRINNSNRILIELSGIKNIDRIKNILQKKAELNFFEIYNLQEIIPYFEEINKKFSKNWNKKIVENEDKTKILFRNKINKNRSLIDLLNIPYIIKYTNNPIVGLVDQKSMNIVNKFLNSDEAKESLPYNLRDIKFLWGYKKYQYKKTKFFQLFSIKKTSSEKEIYPLNGDMIVRAYKSFGPFNEISVNIKMNQIGSRNWKMLTEKNIGKNIAIVLDNLVYTAPIVKSIIPNGMSQISGSLSLQESEDLVNILNAGRLPTSVKIIQSEIIGPSLGKESIQKGILSFFIAIFFVFIWIFFYYYIPGLYANIALIFNLIFIFGILISINAILTFPGISGIILTLAMSMDANVLFYEKIKEEIKNGNSIRTSINNSYSLRKGALSSVIDGQITTLLCGLILFYFGIGPIKGFSTTLIIGIFTSVFSSIFLVRLFLEFHLNKYRKISFNYHKILINKIKNIQWDFLSKRKLTYSISFICIMISFFSFFYKGLNLGIDFVGGRSYLIRFDHKVIPDKISFLLSKSFIENGIPSSPEVKTFGKENQLKVITKYKIWSESNQVDKEILEKMFVTLKPYLGPIDFNSFKILGKEKPLGILSIEKVGPIIAKDITNNAFISISLSLLVIFFYIFIRFKKWQFGLGAVISLLHDTIIVLGIFSLFHKWIPILEIDQTFIAALLTIIGYSVNDTVVVYDKIRKISKINPSSSFYKIINDGINLTLTRTMNTSFMTMLVICTIFFFGGTTIRGFMLALFLGIGIGTYSSIFIASSIVYDLSKKIEKK
ncbi:protein translocase subunit SecDF [Blattabacterium sp. (Cryptocercus kyebangensis)]|uniref:protein translocase subunit SecDF n=1 Tax=Blattabacterium sp. (Cryptocercus kyebangensis) TaxID=298656 RepID=UPI000D7CC9AA|nr:protein translocase subunit SecDF [Blattabacterium sp. (Cryptocercus kyebangensis)]AWU43558.1 protein translocase subunit SecDF [Blattabacterium sp. (Cryptocercus kyebangensis)]